MTGALPPDVLSIFNRTRYLLLDFDGPVCDIFADLAAPTVAERLKKIVSEHPAPLPDEVAHSADPLRVFAYAASTDTRLGARIEAQLTELECAAIATARPTAYVHDVVASCRESGRSVAVVSNNSERAVRSYLTRNGLDDRIDLVVARTDHDATLLKPSPHLIEKALSALSAEPGDAAFVGDSDTDIEAARLAAVPVIGYANTPGKQAILAKAGADAVVTSLADLVLALRARPAL